MTNLRMLCTRNKCLLDYLAGECCSLWFEFTSNFDLFFYSGTSLQNRTSSSIIQGCVYKGPSASAGRLSGTQLQQCETLILYEFIPIYTYTGSFK